MFFVAGMNWLFSSVCFLVCDFSNPFFRDQRLLGVAEKLGGHHSSVFLVYCHRFYLYKPFFCLPWESFKNECGHTREFWGRGSKKRLTFVALSVQPKGSLLGHWTPEQRRKFWEFAEIQGEAGFRHLWEEDLPCLGKYEIEGILSDCQNLSAPSWQLGWWT